jgi:hypothetical protein
MLQSHERIQAALALDMLRSERNRALLLVVVFALLGLPIIGVTLLKNDFLVMATGKEELRHVALVTWLACVVFETWMLVYFRRLLKTGGTPAAWVLPTATVCETMLPTLLLAGMTHVMSPLDAISAPPFLFYFVLIALSPLRMDLKLCMLTGIS